MRRFIRILTERLQTADCMGANADTAGQGGGVTARTVCVIIIPGWHRVSTEVCFPA